MYNLCRDLCGNLSPTAPSATCVWVDFVSHIVSCLLVKQSMTSYHNCFQLNARYARDRYKRCQGLGSDPKGVLTLGLLRTLQWCLKNYLAKIQHVFASIHSDLLQAQTCLKMQRNFNFLHTLQWGLSNNLVEIPGVFASIFAVISCKRQIAWERSEHWVL